MFQDGGSRLSQGLILRINDVGPSHSLHPKCAVTSGSSGAAHGAFEKKTADSQPRFGFPFAVPIEALPAGVAMGVSTQDLETSFFLRTQPATPQTTS